VSAVRAQLLDLYEEYREDPAFQHLRRPNVNLVPGAGSYHPKVLIVGEAPGATENVEGKPFVGASGRALRSLITDAAGLSWDDVFLTNVVKYQPLGNRTPYRSEIEASRPYLRREWGILGRPMVLVACGGTALKALSPNYRRDSQSPGSPQLLSGGIALWPMFNPAYPLSQQSLRPTVEKHWTNFGRWFREEYR
jgi:DNA polymerase